jgi:hypothetical protein
MSHCKKCGRELEVMRYSSGVSFDQETGERTGTNITCGICPKYWDFYEPMMGTISNGHDCIELESKEGRGAELSGRFVASPFLRMVRRGLQHVRVGLGGGGATTGDDHDRLRSGTTESND